MHPVLSRSAAGPALFRKAADFEAFGRIVFETHERHPIRILTWSMISNRHRGRPWRLCGSTAVNHPRRLNVYTLLVASQAVSFGEKAFGSLALPDSRDYS